jgi:CheY-like chemotaxis protein
MKLIGQNLFWIPSELTGSDLSHILQIYEKPIVIPHTYQPSSYFQKLQVLVAEDNEVNRFYIEELLKKLGIECELAHDGYEAVKKFINGQYDLVLMDINMPNLDGITATQQMLRYEQQTGSHHVPIIGLSADAVTKNITSYIAQGLDGYLIKPLRKSDLVKILEELFASRITEFEPPSAPAKEQNMQNRHSFAETIANTIELPVEVVYELFRRYINNAETLMQQLEENPDISGLKHIIHSLKGISRNLYLEPLGALCEQFEKAIPSMDDESKRLRLEELLSEIRRTVGQMREELNE